MKNFLRQFKKDGTGPLIYLIHSISFAFLTNATIFLELLHALISWSAMLSAGFLSH